MVGILRERSRRGFTLLEVIVVLLVLAITVSLSWAAVSGFTNRLSVTTAQGYQERVITAEQRFFDQYGSYTPYASDLPTLNHDVTVVNGTVTNYSSVSIAVGQTTGNLALATLSSAGKCVLQIVPPVGVTSATARPAPTYATANQACNPANALSNESTIILYSGGTAKD